MPIFKLKTFARFARSEKITDETLADAIDRAAKGLVDADLGGGLIKQRLARKGQGKSGGFRTLIAFRSADFSVFLYGFAKSDEANLNEKELAYLREMAADWLAADGAKIRAAIEHGLLTEVKP
jgi:hypothetical protein